MSEATTHVKLSEFLAEAPSGTAREISDLAHMEPEYGYNQLYTPDLSLHCNSCGGTRIFRHVEQRSDGRSTPIGTRGSNYFLLYKCSNCTREHKHYAIRANLSADRGTSGAAYKFGEFPPFGPYIPPKLLALLGESADEFKKGYRNETDGYGVGAFTYYRRVVVAQKNKILGEILKVAERTNASDTVKETLNAALRETQFSKSLKIAKGADLGSLYVDGHNPLTALHSALSDGMHDLNEEECLAIAHQVRIVLAHLAERLSQMLSDSSELSKAITGLINRHKE